MADISHETRALPEGGGAATAIGETSKPGGDATAPLGKPASQAETQRPAIGETSKPGGDAIDDKWFLANLDQLRSLCVFIMEEGVKVEQSDRQDPLALGELNRLRAPRRSLFEEGRPPTKEDWDEVERHRRSLFGILTPPQRRRFSLGVVPKILAWLPAMLALVALASLILAVGDYAGASSGKVVLPFYLIWLMSLGAIGSVAFIGMNALSVQEDITFDLKNGRLIMIRITLGALFGLMLTLPFGFDYFMDFCKAVMMAGDSNGVKPSLTVPAVMLVLPFILGFSTSLVILILNRLVTAVQGFFGQPAPSAVQAATPPAPGVS